MVSERLIEYELGIIRVYSGRIWEQGNMWVPAIMVHVQLKSRLCHMSLFEPTIGDLIHPQNSLDADGTKLPPCHDLRVKANWYIPHFRLHVL